jgi:hypothetical protein
VALSAAEARRQRKQLAKEIAADLREKDRVRLADLRLRIRDVKRLRREALKSARERCRVDRLAWHQRAKDLRRRARQVIRDRIAREKQEARNACRQRKAEIRAAAMSATDRARAELLAERRMQREMASAEHRLHRQEKRTTAAERRQESDDEVRANIDPELVPLFDRVRRSIRGSAHQSRTEAFLHYAEENPGEVIDAQEREAIRELTRLQREERDVRRQLKKTRAYEHEALSAVPF